MQAKVQTQTKPILRGAVRASLKALTTELRKNYMLYIMVLPGILYFLIFRYGPMYGAIIAFKDYHIQEGILGSPWANPWYKHFKTIFESTYFFNILTNTILISIYKLVFGLPAAIIMALLLNEARITWFKRTVQTVTYLPHFLSWVVVYGIAQAVLSPSGGLVNKALVALGMNPVDFIASPQWFRTVIVASDIWKDIGWGAIIFLAALTGISPHLYEAAAVDGASRLQRIWYVTIPGIMPVVVLVALLNIGNLLNAGFEQIFIFYSPSVYSVGDIIDTWVYRQGIVGFQYSVAAAVGLFKGVVGFILIFGTNWLSKKYTGSGIW